MAKKRRVRKPQKTVSRKCFFHEKNIEPSFSDPETLSKFLTERGKIIPKVRSGLCAKHQKKMTKAVKQARHLALLPFVVRG